MISFLFARKKGFAPGSVLIGLFQGISFSHVAIDIEGTIYESVWPKFRRIDRVAWSHKYKLVYAYHFKVDGTDSDNIKKHLESMVGTDYSVLQLALIFFGQVVKPVESYLERKVWNGKKELICSEAASEVLAKKPFAYDFKEKSDTIDLVDVFTAVQDLKLRGVPNE